MGRFGPKHAIGGLFLYAGGVYAGMLYSQGRKKAPVSEQDPSESIRVSDQERADAYNANAEKYDGEINMSEMMSGVTRYRRSLLKNASGSVLEIAAGTGRNIGLYPDGCRVVFADRSEPMLSIARSKAAEKGIDARFVVQNVSQTAFQDNEFDTVVDTFGLCSFDDPVQALREMKRVVKPGGKLLLLEHGRSEFQYEWLNNFLDNRAASHAKKWGCLWNRNINDIVEAAGLKVVEKKIHHFGTCYELIAHKEPLESC